MMEMNLTICSELAGYEFEALEQRSEFVRLRTYARWSDELGRRETLPETVIRYLEAMQRAAPQVPEQVLIDIGYDMMDRGVMGSMRALRSAGAVLDRDNVSAYNCSAAPIDNVRVFSEILYILMCGTGVGYSVQRKFVSNLPMVRPLRRLATNQLHIVQDSAEGWMDALNECLMVAWRGGKIEFDYSLVRPAGARLLTKGGTASGPEPLRKLLDFVVKTLNAARGRQLTTLEASDIVCMIGQVVVDGGVRRSALICISDMDDELMRNAKNWKLGSFPSYRYMANISSFAFERPVRETFDAEFTALQFSGSGERGFFIANGDKNAPRTKGESLLNPCAEILMRFLMAQCPWTGKGGGGQFCNVSAAVMRSSDTKDSMRRKVRHAAILGTIQASLTNFPKLRPGWTQVCEEDRLLGVDVTGHADNPTLSTDLDFMTELGQIAVNTNIEYAKLIGINRALAVTTGKPSGNTSEYVNCAPGCHNRFSKHGIRRIRVSTNDPIYLMLLDQGVPMEKENGQEHLPDSEVTTWVTSWLFEAPEGARLRDDETALEQANRYLDILGSYLVDRGHNQSITIYVRDDEWDGIREWVWDNFDTIIGVSFLPYNGGVYRCAPYEEIDESEYNRLSAVYPVVDFSQLSKYESYDQGAGATAMACTGGSCELI